MRGALPYDDAMLLSLQEREIIAKIIKEQIKAAGNAGSQFT